MNIVFLSNYFNHHQSCTARELVSKSKFEFVTTSKMSEERKALGYGMPVMPDYVVNYKECIQIDTDIRSSDVVIVGSAPEKLLKERIKAGKLIFRYSERPFKRKDNLLKAVPRFIKWHIQNPKGKHIYMLCASAFTSYDYSKYGLFKGKAYKWGYFPEIKTYNVPQLFTQKDRKHILWCGRFLDWKHPDDALSVAKLLKDSGYSFQFDFIGTGVMEERLKQIVKEYNLCDCVRFLGAMKPEQVRENMERSGIYLFTSDRQEGWGAVLNESMNSGCAVVASHAIGAAPYLLKNGENGLIYHSRHVHELFEKVRYLLDNPREQERFGVSAYQTITKTWNAEVAAERFINLAQHILDGEKAPDLYDSGPCSKAEIIKDDWFN